MSCDKQHKHANTIHPDVVQYGFFTCQGKGAKGQSPNVDGFSSGFQLYINEVVLGTVFGILMGPYCANIFDPRALEDSECHLVSEFEQESCEPSPDPHKSVSRAPSNTDKSAGPEANSQPQLFFRQLPLKPTVLSAIAFMETVDDGGITPWSWARTDLSPSDRTRMTTMKHIHYEFRIIFHGDWESFAARYPIDCYRSCAQMVLESRQARMS